MPKSQSLPSSLLTNGRTVSRRNQPGQRYPPHYLPTVPRVAVNPRRVSDIISFIWCQSLKRLLGLNEILISRIGPSLSQTSATDPRSPPPTKPAATAAASASTSKRPSVSSTSAATAGTTSKQTGPRSSKTETGLKFDILQDKVRDGCMKSVFDALIFDSDARQYICSFRLLLPSPFFFCIN